MAGLLHFGALDSKGALYEDWRVRLPSGAAKIPTVPSHLRTSPDGSIYTMGVSGLTRLVTERFGKDGSLMWRKTFEDSRTKTSPRSLDISTAEIDPAGNVVIALKLADEPILVRYSATGVFSWASRIPKPDGLITQPHPLQIVFGSAELVFVLCEGEVIAGFGKDGNPFLVQGIKSPKASAVWSRARVVAGTNLVIAGTSIQQTQTRATTATLSLLGGGLTYMVATNGSWAPRLQIGSGGEIYGISSDGPLFLSALDSAGRLRWRTEISLVDPKTGTSDTGEKTLHLDEANDGLFVFSAEQDRTRAGKAFLYRFSIQGKFQWKLDLSNPQFDTRFWGLQPQLDGSGGVFLLARRYFAVSAGIPAVREVFHGQRISLDGRIADERTFWESSVPAFSGGQALQSSASALPDGGYVFAYWPLDTRSLSAAAATLLACRPTAEFHAFTGATNWQIGSLNPTDLAYATANRIERQGGTTNAGVVNGGLIRYLKDSKLLAVERGPDSRTGFVGFAEGTDQFVLAPHEIALRTAKDSGTAARWIAPRDGEFGIGGLFRMLPGASGTLPSVGVRLGTNLLAEYRATNQADFSFQTNLTLIKGQALDFFTYPVTNLTSTQYVAFQSEIAVPYETDSLELRTTDKLIWNKDGATLQLTTRTSGNPGIPRTVQFLVDGGIVQTSASEPYSATVRLSPGNHLVKAVQTDSLGITRTSSSLRIDVPPQPPSEILMPADQVQRALYVSTTTERLNALGANKYAQGVRVVTLAAADLLKAGDVEDPQAFQGFLEAMLESLERFKPTVAAPLTRQAIRAPRAEGEEETVFGTALTQDELDETLVLVATEDLGGLWTRWSRRVRDNIGAWIDIAADQRDQKMLEANGIIWDQSPSLKQAWDQTGGAATGTSTRATTPEMVNQIQSDTKFQNTMLGDVAKLVQQNGEIRADLQTLSATFQKGMNRLQTGIDAQLQASAQILQGQADLYSYLTNKAALETGEKEQQRKYEETIQGAQSGVFLLSTLIGLGDPKAGKAVSVMGNSFITIADSLDKLSKLDSVFSLGGLIQSANIVGAVTKIFSLFSGGPSADEVILEQIGVLKKMLKQLGQQMNARFDHIDEQLSRIYSDFTARFDTIDFRLKLLAEDVRAIEDLSLQLRSAIARVEFRQQLLFQTQEARRYNLLLGELEDYEHETRTMTTNSFADLVLRFRNAGTTDAADEIAAPTAGRPTDPLSISTQLAGPNDLLTANLNYLNAIILANGWMSGSGLTVGGEERIPSASEWMLGADGLVRLYTRWPTIAHSNGLYAQRIADVKQSGEQLRTALERITLLRSGNQWKTNALWGGLIQNYRLKAARLLSELEIFELTQRRTLIPLTNGLVDQHRQFYADQVDYWMPLDGRVTYSPAGLESVQPSKSIGLSGMPSLRGMSESADFLASSPAPLNLGELLGVVRTTAEYSIPKVTDSTAALWASGRLLDSDTSATYAISEYSFGTTKYYWLKAVTETYEGRLRLNFSFRSDLTREPSGSASFKISEYLNDQFTVEVRRVYSDRYNWDDQFVPPPSFWPRASRTFVKETQPWSSIPQMIQIHWDGGKDPEKRNVVPIKGKFVKAAKPQYDFSEEFTAALTDAIEARLRQLQGSYLSSLATALKNSGTSIGKAAQELSGARELLRCFIELGMSASVDQTDVLRGLISGDEKLPDLETLVAICSDAGERAQTAATHTERPNIALLLGERIAALENVLNIRLAQIQATGRAEILPVVTQSLGNLSVAETLIIDPLRPVLSLRGNPPGGPSFRIFGDRYVPYGLEISEDLVHWRPLAGSYRDGDSGGLPVAGVKAGFIRARSQ